MKEKDFYRIKRASIEAEMISRRIPEWSGVEEIRKWRDRR